MSLAVLFCCFLHFCPRFVIVNTKLYRLASLLAIEEVEKTLHWRHKSWSNNNNKRSQLKWYSVGGSHRNANIVDNLMFIASFSNPSIRFVRGTTLLTWFFFIQRFSFGQITCKHEENIYAYLEKIHFSSCHKENGKGINLSIMLLLWLGVFVYLIFILFNKRINYCR